MKGIVANKTLNYSKIWAKKFQNSGLLAAGTLQNNSLVTMTIDCYIMNIIFVMSLSLIIYNSTTTY